VKRFLGLLTVLSTLVALCLPLALFMPVAERPRVRPWIWTPSAGTSKSLVSMPDRRP